MALPRLNDTPQYTITIPSTGEEVKFRPYLVKEEKVLLLASETQDIAQILNSIQQTISACVENDINIESLSTFDLEYMFMKIRSKSVGEKVEMVIPCPECETPVPFNFDIDEIAVDETDFDRKVQLTDSISLDLRWPSYSKIDLNDDDVGFQLIISCIEAVCTEEERILIDDEPEESITEFLDNLTSEQFKKIAVVVEKLPKVYFVVEETCRNCNTHVDQRIEGLQNFFQ